MRCERHKEEYQCFSFRAATDFFNMDLKITIYTIIKKYHLDIDLNSFQR